MSRINRKSLMASCAIPFLILISSCSPITNSDAPEDTQVQRKPNEADARVDSEKCEAAGGHVERRGMLNRQMCVIPFADAGEACQDSRDCEGRCLTSPRADKRHETGGGVVGSCQNDNTRFGCSTEVEDGVAGPGLCID